MFEPRRVAVALLVLAFSVLAPGCDENPSSQPAQTTQPEPAQSNQPDPTRSTAAGLYGLQVGARWTFLRSGDELRWKEITGCEDVLVLDPVTGAASTVRAYVRENRGVNGTTSVHYLTVDDEGVKRVRRDDIDEGRLSMFATYSPAGPRLYNGPYPDGYAWTFALTTGEFAPQDNNLSRGYSETSAVDTLLGVETTDVVAGSFLTLGVDRQWDANNPHNVESHYAPGVGEVRETTIWPTTPMPTTQTEELVAYTPGYGSCDGTEPLFDAACDAPLEVCPAPWGNQPVGCTDPRVDKFNCGECEHICESGVCSNGQCVESTGLTECVGDTISCPSAWGWGIDSCTSPSRDKWNCGGCGNVCGEDLICDHGVCACGPGTADCGSGTCDSVLDDPENCGGCGIVCGGDAPICDKGVCVETCLSVELQDCGDECVDTDWNSDHCGGCDHECGKGTGTTECVSGVCVACEDAGYTDCDGDCEDLNWSDANCGACGVDCGEDSVCVNAECVTGDGTCAEGLCAGSEVCCGGECFDPRTSDTQCGGCGVATCDGGCTEACRDGACTPVDCGGGDD